MTLTLVSYKTMGRPWELMKILMNLGGTTSMLALMFLSQRLVVNLNKLAHQILYTSLESILYYN